VLISAVRCMHQSTLQFMLIRRTKGAETEAMILSSVGGTVFIRWHKLLYRAVRQ
jgi:hypothetical protein